MSLKEMTDPSFRDVPDLSNPQDMSSEVSLEREREPFFWRAKRKRKRGEDNATNPDLTILSTSGEELAIWTEADGSDVEVGRDGRGIVLENTGGWKRKEESRRSASISRREEEVNC